MTRAPIFSYRLFAPVAALLAALPACSNYKETGGDLSADTEIVRDSQDAVAAFRNRDPSLKHFFDTAYAYAIYPVVAKGAIGIGGAHGNGVVYQDGKVIGSTEVTQGTIGAQLGGQSFSELIFFQNERALEHFKSGHLAFAANASAIAAESGAGASSDFTEGVAVFTLPRGGLMFEAAIGGQGFTFVPKPERHWNPARVNP
ncbi:MAG TPA: YSC84-related protein [Phycisphaerales bacterium]|nr:YSC84-related protein [Phycisphaerales bacterium]